MVNIALNSSLNRIVSNSHLTKSAAYLDKNVLSEDEFKRTDNSLKSHTPPGFDELLVNTIKPICTIK